MCGFGFFSRRGRQRRLARDAHWKDLMLMRLRWLASHSLSGLHAAAALVRGEELVDSQLAEALAGPAAELQQEIVAANLPADRFWRMACALATTFDNNRQLAKMAAYRTLGHASPNELSVRIGGRISDVEAALLRVKPQVVEELALRRGPLREQWEARGPGLLSRIFALTDPKLMVDAADIVLVLPALGGGGEAQLQNNSVRIEAVLTHPHPQLPETVRLGWMLSQLHLDLPHFSEAMQIDRLPHVAALAMLPATLAAAEQVELASFNDETVRLAIDAWQVRTLGAADPVDVVMRWWEAYAEARPPFEVAFKALDEMLE